MEKGRYVGKLIKSHREAHFKNYSQADLSFLLGYKNGQFISNIERAKCSLPVKEMVLVSELLNIDLEVFKNAYIKDFVLELNLKIDQLVERKTDEKNESDRDSDVSLEDAPACEEQVPDLCSGTLAERASRSNFFILPDAVHD
jgi:hypothetical protein